MSYMTSMTSYFSLHNHQVYPLHSKFQTNPQLPVYSDIFHHPASRLKSRRSIWSTATGSSAEELQIERIMGG